MYLNLDIIRAVPSLLTFLRPNHFSPLETQITYVSIKKKNSWKVELKLCFDTKKMKSTHKKSLPKVHKNIYYVKTTHGFQILCTKVNLSFTSVFHELFQAPLGVCICRSPCVGLALHIMSCWVQTRYLMCVWWIVLNLANFLKNCVLHVCQDSRKETVKSMCTGLFWGDGANNWIPNDCIYWQNKPIP